MRHVISWGRTNPASCPRCQSTLHSATGIGDRVMRPAAGFATICDQCCTWLIFEARVFPSKTLTLRFATTEEIASLEPERRAFAERMALALSTTEPKQ